MRLLACSPGTGASRVRNPYDGAMWTEIPSYGRRRVLITVLAGVAVLGIVGLVAWADQTAVSATSAKKAKGGDKIIGESIFCHPELPAGSGSTNDVYWERTVDRGDDYYLQVEIDRRAGKVYEKSYNRLTLRDGVLVRERQTTVNIGSDGKTSTKTMVCGHYADGPFVGLNRFEIGPEDVEKLLKSGVGGPGQDPGEACPLDDLKKVTDQQLEATASYHWKSYDKLKRVVFYIGPNCGDELWPGKGVKAFKCAYGENPAYPKLKEPNGNSTMEDMLAYNRSWPFYHRTQAVDVKGERLLGIDRYVTFSSQETAESGGLILAQVMDYRSGPRPKIKSWHVALHQVTCLAPPDPIREPMGSLRVEELRGDQCQGYKVEIEDVKDGDPALQGEWIKNVIFAGAAYEQALKPHTPR